jgi:nickel transport protein
MQKSISLPAPSLRGVCLGLMLGVLGACAGLGVSQARAHAAVIEAELAQAIRLTALYDTGMPMAHAQVSIYAPDAAATPWGQGVTDRAGQFEFIPDALPGVWAVQVRQAGHGATARIEIGAQAGPVIIAAAGAEGWAQRALMVALVGWGALGTGLFALRGKGRKNASA